MPPIDAGAATTVETAAETTAETTTSSPSRRPEKEKMHHRPPRRANSSAAAEERQEPFNDIAPVYDQLNDVLSLGLHRVWKRAAVKWTGVKKGDRAIDVCCGSGDLALRLADAVGPSGEVVGLDFAAAQLKVAATKETEHPAGYSLSPISWQQGDTLALPHPDASFDGATIGYGLRNVSDIPRALAELRRVLKPGGKAAVVDFNNSTNAAVNQVQGFILDTVVVPAAERVGRGGGVPVPEAVHRAVPHRAGAGGHSDRRRVRESHVLRARAGGAHGVLGVREIKCFFSYISHIASGTECAARSRFRSRRLSDFPRRDEDVCFPRTSPGAFVRRHSSGRGVGSPPVAMEYSMGVPMPQDEHTGLRDGILRECGLHPPVVALASPDAATRLLACARVASLDDREVYFGPPAAGWAAWAMTPPVKGERERVALSPRNETAACALVLELLTEAGEAAAAVLPVARALCDTALAPPSGDDAGAAGAAPPDDAGVGDAMIAWTRAGGPAASTSGAGAETSETSVRVSIVPARFPSTGRRRRRRRTSPRAPDAVRVPSQMLWTVHHAFAEPGARGEAYRTFAALGEDTVAALWLVYEREVLGAASPWAPLLAARPPPARR